MSLRSGLVRSGPVGPVQSGLVGPVQSGPVGPVGPALVGPVLVGPVPVGPVPVSPVPVGLVPVLWDARSCSDKVLLPWPLPSELQEFFLRF